MSERQAILAATEPLRTCRPVPGDGESPGGAPDDSSCLRAKIFSVLSRLGIERLARTPEARSRNFSRAMGAYFLQVAVPGAAERALHVQCIREYTGCIGPSAERSGPAVAANSPSDIIRLLEATGVHRGSRSYRDYEKAKDMLRGMNLEAEAYQRANRAVVEFLEV